MNKDQQKLLLKLARFSIENKLGVTNDVPPKPKDSLFDEKRGVFVSLHDKDQGLRGCIGTIEPIYTLWDAVMKNARSAAFSDPRFWPMTALEMKDVVVEVSVLTVPKILEYKNPQDLLKKLEKNKPGVIIKKDYYEATFLPQVWEQLQGAEVFLTHLCLKAGLNGDIWNTGKIEVFAYEAEVFSE